ncbi:MAG: CPBP family intramembrane metalloprotease [Acidimicrobiales bacterium]|nr:CPBP family intramembrane metalloprotease [Acidimicrobiales bacterium]HRW38577.1 CPBP family intramembrane metalloprotease [Aquihabitans sp.]
MTLAIPSSVTADTEAPAGAAATVLTTRRTLVLALAGLTALVELADVMGAVPGIPVGGITLSTSLLPSLALGLACGSRLLGRSTIRRAATWFWLAMAVVLPVLSFLYWREGRLELVPALVLAALNEELVYRLAVPAIIAAALRLGRVRPGPARIAGLVGAGLWFCLLPGHLEQVTSPAGVVPYVAFAALSAFIVYRSGSILPMALGHAISNLLTVLMWREAVPADVRSIGLACMLGLLVLAYGRPSRITVGDDGGLIDIHTGLEVAAIDLREGQQPLVELADGRLIPVHANMVQPPALPARRSPERAS